MEPRTDTVETLGALLAAAAGPRFAVTEGATTLDHVGLTTRIGALTAQLAGLGIGRGDRVALWLPNGIDYLATIFAVARRGAVAVHVNTRFGPAEVGDLLARTAVRVLFTRSGFAPVDFLRILAAIPTAQRATLKTVICGDAGSIAGHRVVAPAESGDSADTGLADDACLTFTTGGTTAKPKLVVHRQRSIAHHAAAVARRIGTDADDAALLSVVPLCGTFGQVAVLAAVAGGARIVFMDAFDPDQAGDLIARHRITHTVGDDRMIDRLAGAAGDYRTMRFFGVAGFGADAGAAIARGATAGLCPHAIYGSSEVQALFAIGALADAGRGAVTPVDPAAAVRVTGDDLALSGPSLFHGYIDDPAATAAAFDDGYFRTGDRAMCGGDGFVFAGRIGDVLRLGGFLVAPEEIEAFLQAQPGVAEAQVVGVETGTGAAAVAFVIAAADAAIDEAALLDRCRAMLARYKVPRRIVALDAFPCSTGPNGPKISRAELRRLATDIAAPLTIRS